MASAGLSSWVLRLEPARMTATATAVGTRRRASAASTSAAAKSANGPGSARCENRVAHPAVAGRERPRKPSKVRWSIASNGLRWYAVSQTRTAASAQPAAARRGGSARFGSIPTRLSAALNRGSRAGDRAGFPSQ